MFRRDKPHRHESIDREGPIIIVRGEASWEEDRVVKQPPCASRGTGVCFHCGSLSRGCTHSRHAGRILPTHERDQHTCGHASERVQLKKKKKTTTTMKSARRWRWWRRRRRRRRAREAALLYVAPNLSRDNYCARNCRSERNPCERHSTSVCKRESTNPIVNSSSRLKYHPSLIEDQ